MQTSLERQRGLVMQQPRHPVLVAEDQLAGKEHAVGKLTLDFCGERDQFLDAIGAERKSGHRSQIIRMAVVDIKRQRSTQRLLQFLDLLGAAIALRVDSFGANENEIPEVSAKQALHP